MKIDLQKVREMNDEELYNYLAHIKNENKQSCAKCYNPVSGYEIFIKHNNKGYVSTRKLCNLCEKCYDKLIEYLNVEPIDWQ